MPNTSLARRAKYLGCVFKVIHRRLTPTLNRYLLLFVPGRTQISFWTLIAWVLSDIIEHLIKLLPAQSFRRILSGVESLS
jgi:hypothetical protein